MIFTVSLYLALGVCMAGIIFRMGKWVTLRIGPDTDFLTVGTRLTAGTDQAIRTVGSRRIFRLIGIFITDVLLQLNILRQSFWCWIMHIGLFYGMILLILMHALDDPLMRNFFPDYESTLNPYLWLRNLFALMVMAGAGIAMIRRLVKRRLRGVTRPMDVLSLFLIAVIIGSGILLEAAQIVSEPIFNEMVDEYMDEDDEEILAPLRSYWASGYGVVFEIPVIVNPAILGQGHETHEEYCLSCHARPVSAFMSYGVARSIKPMAKSVNRVRLDIWLRYIHFLAAFMALAWLPFGKFFHLIATPINLLVRGSSQPSEPAIPALMANRRALGLDACTHCGICSLHCKVAPIYSMIENITILPSEKLAGISRHVTRKQVPISQTARLAEGSFICTDCGRCTEVCPSGIDLKDLWQASKNDLRRQGFTGIDHWITDKPAHEWARLLSDRPPAPPPVKETIAAINLTDQPDTFQGCIQCTICTTVCPVVEAADDPDRELDLTPQQIMNLLRLQMKDDALGARMVWNCVTCYMCQEHCPQGVKVADVLYELRNIAYRRFYLGKVYDPNPPAAVHRSGKNHEGATA